MDSAVLQRASLRRGKGMGRRQGNIMDAFGSSTYEEDGIIQAYKVAVLAALKVTVVLVVCCSKLLPVIHF